MDMRVGESAAAPAKAGEGTIVAILAAISVSHLLNDLIQSLLPAIYPILKSSFQLDFGQIGLITLAFQLTASLLQPLIGLYTDRRPSPWSLVIGMGFTLIGLVLLFGDHPCSLPAICARPLSPFGNGPWLSVGRPARERQSRSGQ